MKAGDRFKLWIDETASGFADRLATWGMGVLSRGMVKALEDQEPGIIGQVRDSIQQVIDNPDIPPVTKAMLEKSLKQGDIFAVLVGWVLSIIGLIPALFALGGPLGNILNHAQELALRSQILDPMQAITAWRRDPEKYAQFLEDLKYAGWTDERIEALKFVTLYYPAPQDLVRWQAREVFEPSMISKYGLDDEFGEIEREPFYKAGMTDEQILNYWRAHWEHASWNQVVEMLRRGQITEDDVWEWFKVVEIVPYWRDKLIAISWEVPTRVDVRRFWDMRTIDEARLREIYTAQGYHGKDLEDYVLWTKIYVDFPDLMTRYKNGWLTLDDVRAELVKLGMSAGRAEELIQTKVKAVASEALAKQRELTMSQIVKGVKKAVISRDEGAGLLMDMGYDPYEAAYILAIEIPQDEVVTEVKIRELSKSDILSGLKTGVITEPEAMTRLLGLRYTPTDADFLLDIYRAQVKPPVDPKLKEASKADIVLGVKRGLITETEGYIMLLDLDFSPEAADFILMVKAEESPFSPASYNEFKALTDQWKAATAAGGPTMPEELKLAAAEVVRLTRDVKDLEEAVVEEKKRLLDLEPLPPEADARLKELQVFRNRAIAELQRVKSDYDRRLAEWRHSQT